MTLKFRRENGGNYYIYRMEENWTLDRLIQSVPLVNWWYENIGCKLIVRKLIIGTDSLIDRAASVFNI